MEQNLVLNNSSHAFSAWADGIRRSQDQTKVTGSAGSDAAINADLRGELASGALVAAGSGIHAEHAA